MFFAAMLDALVIGYWQALPLSLKDDYSILVPSEGFQQGMLYLLHSRIFKQYLTISLKDLQNEQG